MKLSLSMYHSISIRLGHSVIPEADTFPQLSCLYFCVPSFPSLPSPLWVRSSAWKQMNGTTRDDGWSVAFIIITIVRDVMAAVSLCLERPLPLVASSTVIFRNRCDFLFSLLNRVRRSIIHFPMMWYNRLTYVSHRLRWWPTFFFSNTFDRFRDQLL